MLLRPCVGLVCFCYGLVFFFYLCGSAESGGFVFLYQSSFCRVVFQKLLFAGSTLFFSKIELFVRNKLLQENEHNNNSF